MSTIPEQHRPTLVLASSSPYRAAQLTQLGLSFAVDAPHIDETPHPHEAPATLAARLAREKCRIVAAKHPTTIVIAGDQVGDLEGVILTKPGSTPAAIEQLRSCQGKQVTFHSACAVFDPQTGMDCRVIATQLKFRTLSDLALTRYVTIDQPLDCAGGFKIESAGIALFETVNADDPSALVGLPLICLVSQLAAINYSIFA